MTFATGMQDAIATIDYRTLHSAQTGNTVLLSLSATYDTSNFRPGLANAASSIIAFNVGSFMTGQGSQWTGQRQRAWHFGLGVVQTCMIFGAIWVQFVHGVQERGIWACVTLALMAFQCGSQIAAARTWDVPEITTAMATAAWVDMTRDGAIWALRNRSRDLRVLFFIALSGGVMLGGALRSRIGSPFTLLVAAGIKALAHVSVLFSSAEGENEGGEVLPL